MNRRLHQLASEHGIETEYLDIEDRVIAVDDGTLTALLAAMGVTLPDGVDDECQATCYLPPFLEPGRAWGVTCQVYGLRTERNHGIGDFEDLARLGEAMAGFGADFLGVSPLHAPFLAAAERCSPFFPSNRLLLNPLLIAADRVEGFQPADMEPAAVAEARTSAVVDYPLVARLKLEALRRVYDRTAAREVERDLDALRARHGGPKVDHALFEAISAVMVRRGLGPGWHGWPMEWQSPDMPEVIHFARDRADEIGFHIWLQEVAEAQLAEAAARVRRAGMRIGLYLDLAVGVAPDGSATWSDPAVTIADARIGAPPDMFNAAGQDWGLAPLAPGEIIARDMQPVRELYDGALRHAGALRIDHAMSLQRLYWIPKALPASRGSYVRYPMERLLTELAEASRRHEAIIIGEDLGVVPRGFRDAMRSSRILSYRVLMFEQEAGAFRPPEDYPVDALCCIATHDTATLAGWWQAADIATRQAVGLYDEPAAEAATRHRGAERRSLAALLRSKGLSRARADTPYSADLAVAIHRLAASTPSRLFAVQLEDLLGATDQANIPGTIDEHPNWRRRMPVTIEVLPQTAGARAILAAVSTERPKR